MTPNLIPDYLSTYLPPILPCDPVKLRAGDTLIHAPGFEDRTMAVVDSIVPSNDSRAILIDYLPHNSENRLVDVRRGLIAKGVSVSDEDLISYNRFGPDDFEERLWARLAAGFGTLRAIVDISTMSKLLLIRVLDVCRKFDIELVVIYTEARLYGPSKKEYEHARKQGGIHQPSIQIFTGVYGVVRVDSLSSVSMQGQPTAALVFMSLNNALTQVLLNTVYPSRLFLINGRPPKHTWREEATAWIHDQVRREWGTDNPVEQGEYSEVPIPKRTVSTLDYRETVSLLLKLYWEFSANYRMLLAPGGSKMQAVGSWIVKDLHRDIHIEYPSPEGFLKEYSSGTSNRWWINFGRLSSVLHNIGENERKMYLQI